MFKIMQSAVAVIVAAVLAGTAVLFMSVAPPANAMPQPGLGNEPLTKAAVQLAPSISVAACSARSWPNYDQSCLRSSTGELRKVRVINLETRGARAD